MYVFVLLLSVCPFIPSSRLLMCAVAICKINYIWQNSNFSFSFCLKKGTEYFYLEIYCFRQYKRCIDKFLYCFIDLIALRSFQDIVMIFRMNSNKMKWMAPVHFQNFFHVNSLDNYSIKFCQFCFRNYPLGHEITEKISYVATKMWDL